MEMNHVLVVEDDKEIREGVEIYLKSQGYEVFQAADGIEGLEVIEKEEIHLAIVDIMMPRMDGIRMTMKLREKYDFPVIMLSAKSEEVDKITGLNIGADDYITKPYALAIVKVHIEAILKRAGKQKERVEVGHIAVEPDTWRVYVDEKAIETTPKEYELLSYLIKNKNVVMTRDSILESVWGYDYSGDTRTVDTLVKQLRRKIAPYGSYIRSVYGVGYIFEGEENETAEA